MTLKNFKNQKSSSSTDSFSTEIKKANIFLIFGITVLLVLISFIYVSNLKNNNEEINFCEGSLKIK